MSPLGNESAQVVVKDSSGDPIVTTNAYFSGRGVLIEQPYARLSASGNSISFDSSGQYGSPRDSYISILTNAIYYAAGKQSMLPILWENSYSGQQSGARTFSLVSMALRVNLFSCGYQATTAFPVNSTLI